MQEFSNGKPADSQDMHGAVKLEYRTKTLDTGGDDFAVPQNNPLNFLSCSRVRVTALGLSSNLEESISR